MCVCVSTGRRPFSTPLAVEKGSLYVKVMHFSVQYVVFLERENCGAAGVIGLVSVPDSTMQSVFCM